MYLRQFPLRCAYDAPFVIEQDETRRRGALIDRTHEASGSSDANSAILRAHIDGEWLSRGRGQQLLRL